MGGGAGAWLRAGVLAALTGLLTALGHVAGGGALPGLAMLVVLLPLLAGAFVSVAQRRRGVLGTVATLAAGQWALHQLMDLLHPAHATATAAADAGSAMPVMHAAVTIATALAVRHADGALSALVGALRRVLPRRLAPPAPDRPLPVRALPAPDLPARIARVLAVAHARRGPPVGC